MRASTSTKRFRVFKAGPGRRGEAGSTMIEMVVAMGILMVALLGLVGSMAWGLTLSKRLRYLTDTKLTITSMLEQMETLRNTQRLRFGQIANEGRVNNIGANQPFGGFLNGFQPVSTSPGRDGIYGTNDDLIDAGEDGVFGTDDDFFNEELAHPLYEREISISALSTNLIRIQVTMRYPAEDGEPRDLIGVSYLNNDANSNFR